MGFDHSSYQELGQPVLGMSRENGSSYTFAHGQDADFFVFPCHPVGLLLPPNRTRVLYIFHPHPKLHSMSGPESITLSPLFFSLFSSNLIFFVIGSGYLLLLQSCHLNSPHPILFLPLSFLLFLLASTCL